MRRRSMPTPYGLSAAFQVSDSFAINAFGGYTNANSRATGKDSAEIWYYGLGLALPRILVDRVTSSD